jgi:D-alanyl-D-alanine carboxypeptidase
MRYAQRRTAGARGRLAAAGLVAAPTVSIFVGGAAARRTTPPTPAALRAAVAAFAADHPTYPGVTLAVISPRLQWSGAAGHDAFGSRAVLQPTAGLRIASVTETFTAAAILRLVELGRLGLDDPIVDHLAPATVSLLRGDGYDVRAIRIRHLLVHTSGLYDYASDPAYVSYVLAHGHHHWTPREQVRFATRHGKPYAPPGREFHYSDTGYILLGEIIERQTGRSLAAAYRSLLHFDRLGLRRTYLETREPRPPAALPRAHQYYEKIDATGFDPSFDLYDGGGLVSTVDDLARFYRALLHGRVFDKSATLRTMLGKPNPRRLSDLGMGHLLQPDRRPAGRELLGALRLLGHHRRALPALERDGRAHRQSGERLRPTVATVRRKGPATDEMTVRPRDILRLERTPQAADRIRNEYGNQCSCGCTSSPAMMSGSVARARAAADTVSLLSASSSSSSIIAIGT